MDELNESKLTCVQCGYNLTGVAVGSRCPECGRSVDESIRAHARRTPYGGTLPTVSYVGPVLATIFCCVIGGIVSLVYTAKANTAAAAGDKVGYDAAVSSRTGWLWASVILGIVVGVAVNIS